MKIFWKNAGRALCVILIIVIVAGVTGGLVLKVRQDDGYTKTIVYLGDSICEALLGSSPLSERDSYAYYALIGRNNNFRYVDSSVSGDTTINMYKRITGVETTSIERRYWITEADIIHISILGNDLLGGNIARTACEALEGNYTNINNMLSRAATYFALSIEAIRELNPDAVLMISTLYNPLDHESNLLSQSQKQEVIRIGGGDPLSIRRAGTDLLTRLNNVIYDYLDENPGAFEVIDVYTAFENVYKQNRAEGIRLFYGDWLHPSNEGHALMTELLQEKLDSLGLTDSDFALKRYKTLREDQLVRLFEGTAVNIKAVAKDINKAKTIKEVTKAYFDGIRGVTPIYVREGREIKIPKGEIFEETKTFNLSSLKLGSNDFAGFLDKEKSAAVFAADGTFSVKLALDPPKQALVNGLLAGLLADGGLDLSEGLGGGNFATGIEVYIMNIFPGFDLRYLEKDLELIKSCGLYVNGLDKSNPKVKALMDSLESDMLVPPTFSIPKDFSLEIRGRYFLGKAGDLDEIYMCVGDVSQDGFPFLNATMHTEADGSTWVETSIEVSKVTVEFGKKA